MNAVAVRERPILFSGPMVRAILEGRKSVTRRVVKPEPPEWVSDIVTGLYHPTVVIRGEEEPGEETFGAYDAQTGEWATRCPYGAPGDRLWVRENWTAALSNARAFPGGSSRYESGWRWWHDVPAGMRALKNAHSLFFQADGCEVYVCGDEGTDLVQDWRVRSSSAPRTPPRWMPSIHMPRWASRISLEVTEVRVERVQEITEDDAIAEGIEEFGTVQRAGLFGPTALGALAGIMSTDPAMSRRGFLKSLIAAGAIALGADGRAERATPRAAFAHLWDSINSARGHGWDANDWAWVVKFKRVTEETK